MSLDRRVVNPETGNLVFPEREPDIAYKSANKPYSCDYHTGGVMGQTLREQIKKNNAEQQQRVEQNGK